MEPTPQAISALIGREMYTNKGIYVGEIEDLRVDLDDEHVTDLAITNVNPELFEELARGHRGVLIPYRWIQAVGDAVIVTDIVERVGEPEREKVPA